MRIRMGVAEGTFHDIYSVKNAACLPFVKNLVKCMEINGPTITSSVLEILEWN